MSAEPRTGFDLHIPSSTASKLLPWLVAGALGLTSGGGATSWFDLTGARAYKEGLAEKVSHIDELEGRVIALEAQNAQLLRLLDGTILCTGDDR